jgi:hypothetical protein
MFSAVSGCAPIAGVVSGRAPKAEMELWVIVVVLSMNSQLSIASSVPSELRNW